jgi:hypothetical protein
MISSDRPFYLQMHIAYNSQVLVTPCQYGRNKLIECGLLSKLKKKYLRFMNPYSAYCKYTIHMYTTR